MYVDIAQSVGSYWIGVNINRNSIHRDLVVIQLTKQNAGLVIYPIVQSCRSIRFILIDCDTI